MASNSTDTGIRIDITSKLWNWKTNINRNVTIPHCLKMCEQTGRIENFLVAANLSKASYSGRHYNDSDVFKLVEAISYRIDNDYDFDMDIVLDEIIEAILAAQEPDGYLFTSRTAGCNTDKIGAVRWSCLQKSHELYNVGHLYEAAVAHYVATGKTSLLDAALKNADLVCDTFGADGINDVPGHQEIELGLIKLYELTNQSRYLEQAKLFLDRRGNHGNNNYGEYAQDHLPVTKQSEAVGHSVRAVYMYTAMAEITRITGSDEYLPALDRLWDNVVSKKIYLTGGVGSRHEGESFGKNYELPNKTAYCETCASIGLMFWNDSMFRIRHNAKYFDIFERVLYNAFMAGTSIEGDKFFYVNPLESDGSFAFNLDSPFRKEWFSTACCPENIARFIEKLPKYVCTIDGDDIYINLYIATSIELSDEIKIQIVTEYPNDGNVKLAVTSISNTPKTLSMRMPGWLSNSPFQGGLYQYQESEACGCIIKLNSDVIEPDIEDGYAKITKIWDDDQIEIVFQMPVRKVICDPNVEENRGKYAIERGPVVYCVESDDMQRHDFNLTNGIMAIKTSKISKDISVSVIESDGVTAIPYWLWGNSNKKNMRVWFD